VNASPTMSEPPPERGPIDPRVRARMIQVRREAGRHRLRVGTVVGMVVAALVLAAAVITRVPLLTVGTVDVSGLAYANRANVQRVVHDLDGSSMLTVDLDAARRKLQADPWIERVSITKHWPRTIRIDVAERVPVAAYLAEDNKARVIDDNGVVIATVAGMPTDYVHLVPAPPFVGRGAAVAPGATVPDVLAAAARLARMLPVELRARTREVGVDPAGNLQLHLSPSGTILLGPTDGIRDRLVAVLAVLHRLDPAGITTMDARSASRITCTPACKSLTGR
jgi:cell division protein FtsQ